MAGSFRVSKIPYGNSAGDLVIAMHIPASRHLISLQLL